METLEETKIVEPQTVGQALTAVAADIMTLKLTQLARARREAAAHKAICDTMITEVKESADYQHADETRKRYDEQVAQLDEEIRAMAVAAYKVDGNKHPTPGVEIKERTEVTCTDQDAARKYAIESAPGCIQLDWKALGKIATALASTAAPLPFYQVEKQPQAQIAQNLDKILIDEGLPF